MQRVCAFIKSERARLLAVVLAFILVLARHQYGGLHDVEVRRAAGAEVVDLRLSHCLQFVERDGHELLVVVGYGIEVPFAAVQPFNVYIDGVQVVGLRLLIRGAQDRYLLDHRRCIGLALLVEEQRQFLHVGFRLIGSPRHGRIARLRHGDLHPQGGDGQSLLHFLLEFIVRTGGESQRCEQDETYSSYPFHNH
ncbi:hypothetical protein KSU77_07640 [Parabacteroides distasonis]|nr:hypothetical protein [Parabacteroides distasonis]